MAALLIFIVIAFGGCAFLLYFLYALWREQFRSKSLARVEITKLPSRRPHTGKLIRLYPANEVRQRQKL